MATALASVSFVLGTPAANAATALEIIGDTTILLTQKQVEDGGPVGEPYTLSDGTLRNGIDFRWSQANVSPSNILSDSCLDSLTTRDAYSALVSLWMYQYTDGVMVLRPVCPALPYTLDLRAMSMDGNTVLATKTITINPAPETPAPSITVSTPGPVAWGQKAKWVATDALDYRARFVRPDRSLSDFDFYPGFISGNNYDIDAEWWGLEQNTGTYTVGIALFNANGPAASLEDAVSYALTTYDTGDAPGSNTENPNTEETTPPVYVEPMIPMERPTLTVANMKAKANFGVFSKTVESYKVAVVVNGIVQETQDVPSNATSFEFAVKPEWMGAAITIEVSAFGAGAVGTTASNDVKVSPQGPPSPPTGGTSVSGKTAALFGALSSTLTPAAKQTLDRLVARVGINGAYKVNGFVQGTRITSNDSVLSRARAASVRAYLISKGVSAAKITVSAAGRSSLAGAQGRRVEVTAAR